jgi:alpha-aminoadipate carrier protein LysW
VFFVVLFTSKWRNSKMQATCIECGANLEVAANVMVGEILPCSDCGAELEVISLEPLTLDLAPQEMEDWGE